MTRYICSKMFTDVNIRVPYNSVKNCCKSNDYALTVDELAQFLDSSDSIFTHNSEYMRRKLAMIDDNQLPVGGCDTCIAAEPHSLFRRWNVWETKQLNTERLKTDDNFSLFEITLSSACDLKCTYCSADDSSSWAQELGVAVRRGDDSWKKQILTQFKKYLTERIYQPGERVQFIFNGGEPTYNIETIELIEEIINLVPIPTFVINTNGNTKSKIMDRYLDVIEKNPHIMWRFDCSVDEIEQHAEAVRSGLNWTRFMTNIQRLLDNPAIEVRISPTINMYTIPRMRQFVEYFYQHFKQARQSHNKMFNFNMVQEPPMSPFHMPERFAVNLDSSIEFCQENNLLFGQHLLDIQKVIGTKINRRSHIQIDRKWKYFKYKRPEYDWDNLFPHIPEIIKELSP